MQRLASIGSLPPWSVLTRRQRHKGWFHAIEKTSAVNASIAEEPRQGRIPLYAARIDRRQYCRLGPGRIACVSQFRVRANCTKQNRPWSSGSDRSLFALVFRAAGRDVPKAMPSKVGSRSKTLTSWFAADLHAELIQSRSAPFAFLTRNVASGSFSRVSRSRSKSAVADAALIPKTRLAALSSHDDIGKMIWGSTTCGSWVSRRAMSVASAGLSARRASARRNCVHAVFMASLGSVASISAASTRTGLFSHKPA
jgi:hypothetical protein